MKVSVVIPCHNNYYLLNQVLFDLYKHCVNDIDEIVVVNDASTEKGFLDGLQGFWLDSKMLKSKITLVDLKTNVGFLKASNEGMEAALGDILILLSNDVRVHDNVVDKIKKVVRNYPNGGLIGGRYLDFDTGWNKFGNNIFPYLEGWLLACTSEVWSDLGGFDERFAPNDYEDIDLSTAALEMGYPLLTVDANVQHIGGQTIGFDEAREMLTNTNKKKFEAKWIK